MPFRQKHLQKVEAENSTIRIWKGFYVASFQFRFYFISDSLMNQLGVDSLIDHLEQSSEPVSVAFPSIASVVENFS
jgi:hypothetical protein